MEKAPIPKDEFKRIVSLIIDAQREWFKSCQGLSNTEGDRAISFCGHALVEDEILVIPDTTKDKRFADNPMVIGEPYIRFYAGVPIMSADGARIGVFCIKDTKPQEFSQDDREILEGLAKWAELEINLRNLNFSMQDKFVEKYIEDNKNKTQKRK